MKDDKIVACVTVVCITALGVSYFAFVRQDGSVLITLVGAITAVAGYKVKSIRDKLKGSL